MNSEPSSHEPRDRDAPLSFEQALAELERVVHDLEEGDMGLDAALGRYEQGIQRLRQCQQLLEKAERRIEVLLGEDAEGNPICKPFDDPTTTLEQKAQGRSRRRSDATPRGPSIPE